MVEEFFMLRVILITQAEAFIWVCLCRRFNWNLFPVWNDKKGLSKNSRWKTFLFVTREPSKHFARIKNESVSLNRIFGLNILAWKLWSFIYSHRTFNLQTFYNLKWVNESKSSTYWNLLIYSRWMKYSYREKVNWKKFFHHEKQFWKAQIYISSS